MSETKTNQSIFVILDTLETETSVPGQVPQMQAHTLPREMFPTSEEFEDAEKLEQWAKASGCMHSCMQKGVKAHLIDCRARFKACKKGDTWTNDYGQKNLDGYSWEIMKRPNTGDSKKLVEKEIETLVKSIQTMLDLGLTVDLIRPKLIEKYAEQIVDIALGMIDR